MTTIVYVTSFYKLEKFNVLHYCNVI